MPDGEGGTINLFDSDFMGNADGTVNPIGVFPFGGAVGEPLKSAGFYDPAAGNFRDNSSPSSLLGPIRLIRQRLAIPLGTIPLTLHRRYRGRNKPVRRPWECPVRVGQRMTNSLPPRLGRTFVT